jgi:hypothetical protein
MPLVSGFFEEKAVRIVDKRPVTSDRYSGWFI